MEMYRNDNYKIVGNAERSLYEVINLRSGIVEYEDRAFPKCRIVAEQFNKAIKEPADVVELKAVR